MTYSIVARDAETGQLGVAVQSCMFGTGSIVPWARAGVGAVATQAFADPGYGPRCLDALAAGSSASDALAVAQGADPMTALRQVGIVAADGTAAVTTGALCVDHAGHTQGDGFVAQANMVAGPEVWIAMADAFTSSGGDLAHRLLAALVAAEAAGGDARGRMAAALLVVEAAAAAPGAGTVVDLRVDRSADPLGDLAALLDAADAYAGFNRAVDQLYGGDPAAALATIDEALLKLPGEANLRFVRAGALAGTGDTAAGLDEMRALVAERPTWDIVIRGFAANGLLTLPDGIELV